MRVSAGGAPESLPVFPQSGSRALRGQHEVERGRVRSNKQRVRGFSQGDMRGPTPLFLPAQGRAVIRAKGRL